MSETCKCRQALEEIAARKTPGANATVQAMAHIASTAIASGPCVNSVPDGWKLVPVGATDEMIAAAAPATPGEELIARISWRLMCRAAPCGPGAAT